MQIKFFKVTTLPEPLEPDAFYFVENSTFSESYLTNNAGVARAVGNSAMITSIVNSAVAAANAVRIVADIDARNSLTAGATANMMILVLDATDDPTVTIGSALYAFSFSSKETHKVAEYESMDVVMNWSSIAGRPTSAVADIDDAVAKRHTHANKTVLDKWSEGAGGIPLYDGSSIRTEWETNNW